MRNEFLLLERSKLPRGWWREAPVLYLDDLLEFGKAILSYVDMSTSRGLQPLHPALPFARPKGRLPKDVEPLPSCPPVADSLRRTDEYRPDKNSGLRPSDRFVRLLGIHPSGSGGDGTGSW